MHAAESIHAAHDNLPMGMSIPVMPAATHSMGLMPVAAAPAGRGSGGVAVAGLGPEQLQAPAGAADRSTSPATLESLGAGSFDLSLFESSLWHKICNEVMGS
jgi:hypothetical protein